MKVLGSLLITKIYFEKLNKQQVLIKPSPPEQL